MLTTTAKRLRAPDLAVVAAGGVVGASLRYAFARALPTASGSFPWATLLTNGSGSFVLGVVLAWTLHRPTIDPRVRLFIATGIIGAFTTMSTYAVETCLLVRDGHAWSAALYASTSVIIGVTAAWVGTRVAPR